MTTVVCAIAALLAITSCAAEAIDATPTFDVDAELAVLESLTEQYYDATKTQDSATLDRFVSPQVSAYYGIKELRGTGGRERWDNDALRDTSITVNRRRWVVMPGLAVTTSEEVWTFPREPERQFLLTTVWEKVDGRWLVVHVHMSEVGP
jgi:hypothetical protein